MPFSCIAGALEHPIAGVQHRSVWLGLYTYLTRTMSVGNTSIHKPQTVEILECVLLLGYPMNKLCYRPTYIPISYTMTVSI